MLKTAEAFTSFSVSDLRKAKAFCGQLLGLDVSDKTEGLELHLAENSTVFMYPKPDHVPATYPVLNFPVDSGPKTAWFKDPSGNILSVLEER